MTKHSKEIDRLKKIVEAFPQTTVTVLADLVADEFIFGEISRVSREAPVLILKHRERKVVPGGGMIRLVKRESSRDFFMIRVLCFKFRNVGR